MEQTAELTAEGAEPHATENAQQEAYGVLLTMVQRKARPIPGEVLAAHVLRATPGADFAVRRAAMEALLRRLASARDGQLQVLARPPGRSRLGPYRVGRPAGSYRALLRSLEPLSGSCECRDFLRSSLGLCKHLLRVLDDHFESGRTVSAPELKASAARMEWDPLRPLTGTGDWLERVRWCAGPPSSVRSLGAAAARRWFTPDGARVKAAFAENPARRLALVSDLLRSLSTRGRPPLLPTDPALVPLLRDEVSRLKRRVDAESIARDMTKLLKGLKLKLYPYQLEGVERFLRVRRLLLADDMGLGKTAQAIAACHALLKAGEVKRGLILTPAALKPQWVREWQTFTDVPITLVEGGPEARAATVRSAKTGFLLMNYEQLLRDLPVLLKHEPELVVLDEAQRLKNWSTKTSLYVKQLNPEYRLVLTGTPMENRLDELASLLDWVDDHALEPKWRLGAVHSATADGTREVVGAKNLDTLRARIGHCFVRRVRREVLAQLPERTDTRLPVLLTPEQQAEHDELNQPIASLVGRARTRPLTHAEFIRLMTLLNSQRIICNGLAQLNFEETWPALRTGPTDTLLQSLFSPKLTELRELVANVAVGQRRKMVIFSQWKRMLKLSHWAVADLLAKAGLRAAFFTGDEGQRRRTQNLVDFHDDPAVAILFATDAGGVGLNLQRAASCCVNLEVPWNPAVREQRVGRVHRNGQSRPVEVYNLISEGGIESRIAALVSNKKALFDGLFDGQSDEVTFERSGSFISRIEKLFEGSKNQPSPGEAHVDVLTPEPELADALPAPEPAAVTEWVPPRPEAVSSLFQSIQIKPGPDGRVILEAPAEAAATLAAVFEGMAKMLTQGAVKLTPPATPFASSVAARSGA